MGSFPTAAGEKVQVATKLQHSHIHKKEKKKNWPKSEFEGNSKYGGGGMGVKKSTKEC